MSQHLRNNLVPPILLAAILSASSIMAQDEPSQVDEFDESLPAIDDIMDDLVEIRGLDFKRYVPSARQSEDEFEAYLREELHESFPVERFGDVMDGLVRLGMVRERFELDEGFIHALLSQAAAYYDPETGTFYYLIAESDEEMRFIASHELVHALQDQHFDLGALTDQMAEEMLGEGPRNDDRMLAITCLAEGEATYVMFLWQAKHDSGIDLTERPEIEAAQFKSMAMMDIDQVMDFAEWMAPEMDEGEADAMTEALREMKDIPTYIMRPMYAAYMSGAYMAMMLRQHGGWEALNAAWGDLPESTEQCLHPEKYFGEERDAPTPVTLPAFDYLADLGWTEIDSAIHGELYLNLLLREQGDRRRAADIATEGWDGDLYRAWRNDGGDVMIVLATTWDTEKDARQFYKAYRRILPHKYEAIEFDGMDDDRFAEYVCGEGLGAGILFQLGQEVFVVEGCDEQLCTRIATDLIGHDIQHVGTVKRGE